MAAFTAGLQGDFQLISRLIRLRLEFMVLFQHDSGGSEMVVSVNPGHFA